MQHFRKLLDDAGHYVCMAIAVLCPAMICVGHLSGGADHLTATATIAMLLSVQFLVLTLFLGAQNITLGTASIAALSLTWIALGLHGNWFQARQEILALITALLIWNIGRAVGLNRSALRFAWIALILSSLIVCGATLISLVMPGTLLSAAQANFFEGRVTGPFGSANTAATFFGISLILSTARALHAFGEEKFWRMSRIDRINQFILQEFITLGVMILSLTCLLLTVSRAGILLSIAILVGFLSIEVGRLLKRVGSSFRHVKFSRRIAVALSAAFFALAFFGTSVSQRTAALSEGASSRLDVFAHYWDMWQSKPLFGHGLGSFNRVNDASVTLDNVALLGQLGAAHNFILQWLIQQGLVGLVLMILVVGALHMPIVKALLRPSKRSREFERLVIAVSLLLILHGLVDYALEIPSIMWTYAFVLGLGAGYVARASRRDGVGSATKVPMPDQG